MHKVCIPNAVLRSIIALLVFKKKTPESTIRISVHQQDYSTDSCKAYSPMDVLRSVLAGLFLNVAKLVLDLQHDNRTAVLSEIRLHSSMDLTDEALHVFHPSYDIHRTHSESMCREHTVVHVVTPGYVRQYRLLALKPTWCLLTLMFSIQATTIQREHTELETSQRIGFVSTFSFKLG